MKRNRSLGTLSATLLIFSIAILVVAPGAWAQSKFKTLHTFQGGIDGSDPTDSLIFDGEGNLYGTTSLGGNPPYGGTVFKLKPNADGSWKKSVLYTFCSLDNCIDGGEPIADLVFDQEGNLYGTTLFAGQQATGNVFKLAPNADGSWKESVLYSFCSESDCVDGGQPWAGLTLDKAGNLYGTTPYGGAGGCNCGVVFKLTTNAEGNWVESVLYSFAGGSDGGNPFTGVVFDPAGNLYGTTSYGGNTNCGGGHGCGVVFRLTPNAEGGWKEKVLHQFTGKDGAFPTVMIIGAAGSLYGATGQGGAQDLGTIFQLAPNAHGSWKEKLLHQNTDPKRGFFPFGLTFDKAGNLYGTDEAGGNLSDCVPNTDGGCGVVFKLTPNSRGGWSQILLHSFVDHPGALPLAGVIFDAAGNLYGTTQGDQNTTFGSVFEIMP